MRATTLSIQALQKRLAPVFRRYRIKQAFVFGSLARGEADVRSDVDLIVVRRTSRRFFDRYHGLLRDLNRAVRDRPVEALIYTPKELEAMRRRPFLKKALAEGQVIYERQ
jgi:predicted nucleotidyltransferase